MQTSAIITFFKNISFYLTYRKRFESIPGFMEFFNQENAKFAVTRVRMLCVLGITCYLAVGLVDYLLYPDLFPLFLTLRVIFATITAITLALTLTSWGRTNALALIFVTALSGELIVSIMTSQLTGWSSVYFVGILLITTAVTMFIPWRPRVSLLYCTISWVGYIVINRMYHPFSLEMSFPVMFILINGVNSYFSSLGSELSRMSQLASRLEVEKAHEELKRLDEAKARFFSNISHELRTPLTLIIGPLSALAKRGGGMVTAELIESMTSNAQRLLRQVNALLDLGKLDSQEMKCNLEAGNLKSVISDLYKAAAPGALERGITLKFDVPQEVANSMFDLEKIETIVANLISNAIKFTPSGGSVILSCVVQEDGMARLSVKDTGPGIPLDQQQKIFGRFHQVDDSAKKVSKGTGLGLSVAKEFAELHGGRIWVESEVGHGTQFNVELPFTPADQSQLSLKDSVSLSVRDEARSTLLVDIVATEGKEFSDANIPEENVRRMTGRSEDKPLILYVDDSRDLRRYVDSILSDSYTVLLAQDGAQGLEQALLHLPELILSDVMMPIMNGFEFCRAVRNEVKLKSIPFVLLTANSSLDSRIEGLEDGADDYLSKPFSERELIARIKNLVSLRRQAQVIKKQIDAAKEIQQTLLPPMTQSLGGVTIEAIYEPSEELSGDFFDTIACGDWVYVYVADVTGHGLPAAQITYLVKEIIKHALVREMDLAALFDIVRKKYLEHRLEYDLGLQLMRLNSKTGELEYLRSNAPNPIVVDRHCAAEELDTPISPLISSTASLTGEKSAQVVRMKLERNSALYFYSDGAYEFVLDSGREFGLRRLVKTVASSHPEKWPEGLTGRLKSENVEEFFPDDLTILRVSFTASKAPELSV